jgi:hypothetical protein
VEDNFTEWSDERVFETTLPEVELVSPLNREKAYPWPTVYQWKPVKGAAHYLLDITDCDAVFAVSPPSSR